MQRTLSLSPSLRLLYHFLYINFGCLYLCASIVYCTVLDSFKAIAPSSLYYVIIKIVIILIKWLHALAVSHVSCYAALPQ